VNIATRTLAIFSVVIALAGGVYGSRALIASQRPAAGQGPALRILVIQGEDAVNIIQQKTAVAPVVEVRDRNDLPVSGAAVTFTISGGKTATFTGGAQAVTVTTNAAGRAIVGALNPLSSGGFQINVQAAFQGQTAVATIAQTNVLTAAEAAAASTAGASGGSGVGGGSGAGAAGGGGAGGGGLSSGAIAGIVGGAAAGAAAAAAAAGSGDASGGPTFTVSPTGTGIRDVTVFTFTAAAGHDSYSWDFADGGRATGAAVTHTFASEGTFQVTLTTTRSGDAGTATAAIVVGSVTGMWRFPPGGSNSYTHTLILAQQGSALTGTWRIDVGPACGPAPCVPGEIQLFPLGGSLGDSRRLTVTNTGGCQRTYTADASGDLRTLSGSCRAANAGCAAIEGSQVNAAFARQ
jgi:PKD repeat protein